MPVSSILLPDGRKLESLKVPDLKKELEIRGLSRSGIKKDLYSRLASALKNANTTTEDSVQLDNTVTDGSQSFDDSDVNASADGANTSIVTSETDVSKIMDQNESTGVRNIASPIPTPDKTTHKLEQDKGEVESVKDAVTIPDTKIQTRRRQWGNRNADPELLSSQSLEKLLPTPIVSTPPPQQQQQAPVQVAEPTESKVVESDQNLLESSNKTVSITQSVRQHDEFEMDDAVVDTMYTDDVMEIDSRTVRLQSDNSTNNDDDDNGDSSVHIRSGKRIVTTTTNDDNNNMDDDDNNNNIIITINQTDSPADPSTNLEEDSRRTDSRRKGPKETKAVGYMVDAPERVEDMQSSRHPPTNILYIRFLVRPFTVEQLKQMITSHYGPVVDLWLNKIKSTSLVQMQSVEEAIKCRDSLDGSRWPLMNPRVLRCDFATMELFDWMKVNGDSPEMQLPKHLLIFDSVVHDTSEARQPPVATKETSDETAEVNADSEMKMTDLRHKIGRSGARDPDQQAPSVTKPTGAAAATTTTENQSEASTNNALLETKPDEPAKMLNDLFRKTQAAPSIYWLPVSPDQTTKTSADSDIKTKSADNLLSDTTSMTTTTTVSGMTTTTTSSSATATTVSANNTTGVDTGTRRKSRSPFANRPQTTTTQSNSTHRNNSASYRSRRDSSPQASGGGGLPHKSSTHSNSERHKFSNTSNSSTSFHTSTTNTSTNSNSRNKPGPTGTTSTGSSTTTTTSLSQSGKRPEFSARSLTTPTSTSTDHSISNNTTTLSTSSSTGVTTTTANSSSTTSIPPPTSTTTSTTHSTTSTTSGITATTTTTTTTPVPPSSTTASSTATSNATTINTVGITTTTTTNTSSSNGNNATTTTNSSTAKNGPSSANRRPPLDNNNKSSSKDYPRSTTRDGGGSDRQTKPNLYRSNDESDRRKDDYSSNAVKRRYPEDNDRRRSDSGYDRRPARVSRQSPSPDARRKTESTYRQTSRRRHSSSSSTTSSSSYSSGRSGTYRRNNNYRRTNYSDMRSRYRTDYRRDRSRSGYRRDRSSSNNYRYRSRR